MQELPFPPLATPSHKELVFPQIQTQIHHYYVLYPNNDCSTHQQSYPALLLIAKVSWASCVIIIFVFI